MHPLILILVSTFLISFAALVGILTISIAATKIRNLVLYLISLSAGAMMGGAFLHLLPESLDLVKTETSFSLVLSSFIVFFLVEKVLHWHHCHEGKCDTHTIGHMNLIGDAVHNFIDGLVIAASFGASLKLGIITSLAVALHEIPQEIGDFGVLLYAGWNKRRALIANYIVALTVVIGGIVGFIISESVEVYAPYLMSFASGGFIYISASDLMPELRKEPSLIRSLRYFSIFLLGLILMYALKFIN